MDNCPEPGGEKNGDTVILLTFIGTKSNYFLFC